jgi:hypothetical protein
LFLLCCYKIVKGREEVVFIGRQRGFETDFEFRVVVIDWLMKQDSEGKGGVQMNKGLDWKEI